jgi:hypothetical protein
MPYTHCVNADTAKLQYCFFSPAKHFFQRINIYLKREMMKQWYLSQANHLTNCMKLVAVLDRDFSKGLQINFKVKM